MTCGWASRGLRACGRPCAGRRGSLAADEVVTAIGVRPAVAWLTECGIGLHNGVAVDEGLRSSMADVFAAGDCAAFWSRRYRRRLRVEHWDNALHAPEVVAANVLGESEVYDPVPYFWSEQFGRMVQYVGHYEAADHLVWRGDPAGAAVERMLARGRPTGRGAGRGPPARPRAGAPCCRVRRPGGSGSARGPGCPRARDTVIRPLSAQARARGDSCESEFDCVQDVGNWDTWHR